MNDFLVYIVDDDPNVLDALQRILMDEGAEVRTYVSAEKFIQSCNSQDAACLILDLKMPGMTGLGLLDWLKAHNINMPVIVVSGHGDIPAVVDSMKHGATEYMAKPADPALLIAKVRELAKLSHDRVVANAKLQRMRDNFATLTERERQMIDLIAQGLSSKQIAAAIGISLKTVENHRSHLLAKTNAVNVANLVHMRMLVSNERTPVS
jgi:FixJ family two-component response regulator